jgi:hypothetical protein
MPSNALLSNAWQKTAGKLDVTSTPVIESRQATCASMQSFAGVLKRLPPQTKRKMPMPRVE